MRVIARIKVRQTVVTKINTLQTNLIVTMSPINPKMSALKTKTKNLI